MAIDRILDGVDLSGFYTVLSLAGALLAVYVMQVTRYEAEDRADPPALRNARTAGLAILSLSLLWSLTFSETRQWQPWPPALIMLASVDALLVIKIIAIRARIRRLGRYRDAPSVRNNTEARQKAT